MFYSYYIDVQLSHLNKDYLLTYLLTYLGSGCHAGQPNWCLTYQNAARHRGGRGKSGMYDCVVRVGEVLVERSRVVGQVMVECPGFATVKFDGPSGLCSAQFGSGGTTVDCSPGDGGAYAVFPDGGGGGAAGACLRVDAEGTAVYYGAAATTTSTDDDCGSPYYVMRHGSDVVVETVDANGFHYVVTRTGENHVGKQGRY